MAAGGAPVNDEQAMRLAIETAERARGRTGDNPWVGCVIVGPDGELLGRGHTQGPGEDHAEIAAARDAAERGHDLAGATLYSTLEPCAFHGRTPSCARSIVARRVRRVVVGMRDPHPRVDGQGIAILREGGVDVVEGVLEDDVRRQLGPWVWAHHPHDVHARLTSLQDAPGAPSDERAWLDTVAAMYGLDVDALRSSLR